MPTKKQAGSAPWTDPDDAPELTADMLDRAEVFDGNTFVRRGRGRPKSNAVKEQISVRLDPDVLAKLRERGPGWQSQINVILRQAFGLAGVPDEAGKTSQVA
ncbi:MAG: BrnA antitoxin family protein [Rhodospirillales bacterium]|nr:BrnA antitoxin family protein [Rhodospirillales bacterium]